MLLLKCEGTSLKFILFEAPLLRSVCARQSLDAMPPHPLPRRSDLRKELVAAHFEILEGFSRALFVVGASTVFGACV